MMRYKLFGRSGLRVSELALGTMTFGEEWGWGASKETCKQIFDIYVNAGGNFIDTANRYTEGTSERFTGEFIASDRDYFILATKYTLRSRNGDPNSAGSQRKNMVQALEASLKRLGTDYVDLYWVHAWDEFTPTEEVMRGLDDLVRAGKVLYVGVSDTPAWVISHANTLANLRGWSPFVGLQIRYSLLDRAAERDLLPMARSFNLAVTPWSILGAGALSGKYVQPGSEVQDGRAARWGGLKPREQKVAEAVHRIAGQIGHTPSQVAINWVRQKPGSIIPIIGARKIEQLQDNLGCLGFTLEADLLAELDRSSPIELGFPHDFLASEEIREIVYGGYYSNLKG
jgi:aryl-alcohol dehydrogenase-like predicted oxidoreductase